MHAKLLGVAVLAGNLAAGAFGWVEGRPQDPAEADLLARRTLCIRVDGVVTGSFDRASAVLGSPDLLERVQRAYAERLPAGQEPEFRVQSAGGGRYFYVNRQGERCDIRELRRELEVGRGFRAAFHVAGERWFGPFESLIYVTVEPVAEARPGQVRYVADVRVWPQGALVRTVLRCMPGVERYFRRKTAEMRTLISGIFVSLAGPSS